MLQALYLMKSDFGVEIWISGDQIWGLDKTCIKVLEHLFMFFGNFTTLYDPWEVITAYFDAYFVVQLLRTDHNSGKIC